MNKEDDQVEGQDWVIDKVCNDRGIVLMPFDVVRMSQTSMNVEACMIEATVSSSNK